MRVAPAARRLAFVAIAAVATGSAAGCSHNRQVYDMSANRNRTRDRQEDTAYRRWERERNMSHAAYESRRTEEQRQYWEWRRDHS